MDEPDGTSKAKTRNEPQPALNQKQTADYVASLSLGLMSMAGSADMPFLAYLLDMAAQEAMQQGGKPRRRRTDRQ